MDDEEQSYTESEEARRERQLAKEDLQRVMWEPWGRRFVYRHLARAGVYRSSFIAGQPDSTSFNEGQRNMGLMLIADLLAVCPIEYSKMLAENSGK